MFKFKINKTLLKYFFSYIFLLLVLLFSFMGLLQNKLSSVLLSHEEELLRGNLNNAASTFSNMMNSIHYADTMLAKNVDLILARYDMNNYGSYLLTREIEKYTYSNRYVDTGVYIDMKNDILYSYSKSYYLTYRDRIITITSKDDGTTLFMLDQYLGKNTNQLIHLSEKDIDVLIYMPAGNSTRNYSTFYMISPNEVNTLLNTLLSENVLYASFTIPKIR